MHRDLWIKGAVPGKVTTASDLKVHIAYTGLKPIDFYKTCIGYVDWTREDRIAVRLASNTDRRWTFRGTGAAARLVSEPGPYRIIEDKVHRVPKPEKQ